MFCSYCGSQIEENVKFCSCCGKPVLTGPAEPIPPQYMPIQEPVKKSKKGLIFGLIGGVAAIVAVVLILVLGKGNTYTDPIDTFMKGMQNRSISQAMDAYPPEYGEMLDLAMSLSGMDEDQVFDQMMDIGFDDFTYTIGEAKPMDKDEIEYYADRLARMIGLYDTGFEVTEGYMVDVTVTSPLYGSSTDDLAVGMIDGKWYLIESLY